MMAIVEIEIGCLTLAVGYIVAGCMSLYSHILIDSLLLSLCAIHRFFFKKLRTGDF